MSLFKKYQIAIILIFILTALVIGSLLWNSIRVEQLILEQAYTEADTHLNKDITFRRWASDHGGVYVPITENQQPVSWLQHVPERDITSTEGKTYTLINPATMVKQVMSLYAEAYNVEGRLTALKVLNPENKPDDWERKQLEAFERKELTKNWEIIDKGGEPHLRYLTVLYMEKGCMKCHGVQGYKVGDVRGGIGLNLPMTRYFNSISKSHYSLLVTHSLIWLLGILGIALYTQLFQQRQRDKAVRKREIAETDKVLNIYANTFETSGEAIVITDSTTHVINANPAYLEHSGYTLQEVLGKSWENFYAATPLQSEREIIRAQLEEKHFWQGETRGLKKNGDIFPMWMAVSKIFDANGHISSYIISYSDISERKADEAQITQLAHHDILTKLHNRYSLEDKLSQAITHAKRTQSIAALFIIDLDRFKNINDSLGHNIGDALLIQVADRLKKVVESEDTLARIGGDEFVILLPDVQQVLDAAVKAEQIREQLNRPYNISGHEIEISACMGISMYPNDGKDTFELLKNADIAMYQAKAKGWDNYQFFTESMSLAAQERLQLEREMRLALQEGGFELHFQPILSSDDRTQCRLEALIRWNHPTKGRVSPDKFIPIAEETGFILALGDWILDEACACLSKLKQRYSCISRVSINLSAKQLQSSLLIEKVERAMAKYNILPGELEFEITETSAMVDPDFAVAQLNRLNKLNVSLAIDDFGTGYSSLAYLKKLPIDTLKLDKTFVDDIGVSSSDEEICAATIALAHNLGLQVVAEGVETKAQLAFLEARQCDYLQGYYFSKPLPMFELEHYLAAFNPPEPSNGNIDTIDPCILASEP